MSGTPSTYRLLDSLSGWQTVVDAGTGVQDSGGVLVLASAGATFRTAGTWYAGPLDSGLPGCQWHRLQVWTADLPPSTAVVVATFTSEDRTTPVADLQPEAWSVEPSLTGSVPRPGAARPGPADLLIQSPPGRYLWVRLQLSGNGAASPRVRQVVVHYPRNSYLRYLPAVFGSSDAGRAFLERFLSIPQTEWDDLRRRISMTARYFDPRAVPEEGLDYLGSWLDATFEPGWTADQRRRVLTVLPSIRAERGTVRAVQVMGGVYLRNIAGDAVDGIPGYPYLVEGFRRRQLMRSAGVPLGHGRVGDAEVARRLRLGTTSRIGGRRLVPAGDPAMDVFTAHAHRVLAVVPSGWISTAAQQNCLERGLRVELPAHVQTEIRLVDPFFQLDAQSTLGVDTVAGPQPGVRLASPLSSGTALSGAAPPSARPPRCRLGYDTVLGRAPQPSTFPTPYLRAEGVS